MPAGAGTAASVRPLTSMRPNSGLRTRPSVALKLRAVATLEAVGITASQPETLGRDFGSMASRPRALSIGQKLALLASIPGIAALALAWLVVSDARREAKAAEALGTVEDLAELAADMSAVVQALQNERAQLSRHLGKEPGPATAKRFAQTDHAIAVLDRLLQAHGQGELPPRLSRDLAAAHSALAKLGEHRTQASTSDVDVIDLLGLYKDANGNLINAIAALMQLSDHGEVLRTISLLVSVLQIQENASQEHALLTDVFTRKEFAPGAYRELVTLVTEHAVNERVLLATADDLFLEEYRRVLDGDFAVSTARMRKRALEAIEEELGVDGALWFGHQARKVERLRGLADNLNASVKDLALARIAALERALTSAVGLSLAALALSALLAWPLGRGVTRSVTNLSRAAAKVQQERDYSARAARVSDDELGALTEAFNEMLVGIQKRDAELEGHRRHLEKVVDERTAELTTRNQAMRAVLDNVEQGLAMVRVDGTLEVETSAAFARWLGTPAPNTALADHLAQYSQEVAAMTRYGWDTLLEGVLPWELCLLQMPSTLIVKGRHYHLTYRGVVHGSGLAGALLVVSDVTDDIVRAEREALQQEVLAALAHIAEDRAGFMEWLSEMRRLINATTARPRLELRSMMRLVHTIKGTSSVFGVASVSAVAQRLESALLETREIPGDESFEELGAAWQSFEDQISSLVSEGSAAAQVTHAELDSLLEDFEQGVPRAALRDRVASLRFQSVRKRLDRAAAGVCALAERLGKGPCDITVETDDVRLSDDRWNRFFAVLSHPLRNALDHGMETSEEREVADKPASLQLALRFHVVGDTYKIEIEDDGRGIAWDKVDDKAAALGMSTATREDLTQALFADGLSTRDDVGELSGRGVGMAAFREAVEELGGQILVSSEARQGTLLRCFIPRTEVCGGAKHVA